MEFDQFNNNSEDNFDDNNDLREAIGLYLIQWKWYILSILIFGTLSYYKLRNEAPKYQSSAKILIKELGKGSSVADLSSFEDLGLIRATDNSLDNEIHILTSRRLMKRVVKELNLNTKYFIEDSPYNKEIFPNYPIILEYESKKTAKNDSVQIQNYETLYDPYYNTFAAFSIAVLSKNKYKYFNFEGETLGIKNFDEYIKTSFGRIKISLNKTYNSNLIGKNIIVSINPIEFIADSYMQKIVVEPIEGSRVVTIAIREGVVEKGMAIVNNLIEQYNADAVEDKNMVHLNTIKFLDERIELLTSELTAVERTAEQFKTKNRMVNPYAGGDAYLNSSSVNESDLIKANMMMEMVNFMLGELKSNNNNETLPVNIGLSDVSINNLVGTYNDLVLSRIRILKSSYAKNPAIVRIDSDLIGLKNNLVISLNNLKSSTKIKVDLLAEQSNVINYRIASVPKNERKFKDIIRQQETKNILYKFLLQKREEAVLSKSVNVDKAKIVDPAYSNRSAVSPKKKVTYIAAILIGLLIPTLIIYLRNFLDTKVRDEKDLMRLKIPFIGDVPEINPKKFNYIKDGDTSNLAEAFRYIRTNLGFMLDSKEYGKTIFVTSTIKGEGKTFTAINLASSLAISGKKTLILGMDLRAPKISNYIAGVNNKLGITNYIKDESITLDNITVKHPKFSNLDLINSGNIPPNPVELLMSKKVGEIFDRIKKNYEYIVVDTAPVGMVTDTIQIGKYSDLTIYIVKANYLDKRMLHIPEKLHKENKLPNMAVMINGSDHSKGVYGYGYGYGNEKKKSWLG